MQGVTPQLLCSLTYSVTCTHVCTSPLCHRICVREKETWKQKEGRQAETDVLSLLALQRTCLLPRFADESARFRQNPAARSAFCEQPDMHATIECIVSFQARYRRPDQMTQPRPPTHACACTQTTTQTHTNMQHTNSFPVANLVSLPAYEQPPCAPPPPRHPSHPGSP